MRVFLELCCGDAEQYAADCRQFDHTSETVKRVAAIYGLPNDPNLLDEEQRDIVRDAHPGETFLFQSPASIQLGRIEIDVDDAPGLKKTRDNFVSLCTGDKGQCKNAPTRSLHYKGVPFHRIVDNFVCQGGDVVKLDGSAGESIYGGGKFNDDKEGLQKKARKGSVGMANSGKNSNTSQFFFVLTSDPKQLAKLNGKHVFFGQVRQEDEHILDKIQARAASADGTPREKVWVDACGLCT